MSASGRNPGGPGLGRMLALCLNGLAVLWVIAVSLSIVADAPRTAELVVLAIQATVALGMQAYAIWRIATGWASLSNPRRVGLTLLGVIIAPIALSLGIVVAAVAALIWLVVAAGRGGAARSRVSDAAERSNTVGSPETGTGWVPVQLVRKKGSMCVDGKLPCVPCGAGGTGSPTVWRPVLASPAGRADGPRAATAMETDTPIDARVGAADAGWRHTHLESFPCLRMRPGQSQMTIRGSGPASSLRSSIST
jgi:hypothetical protein